MTADNLPARELPKLPIVNDARLVAALAEAEHEFVRELPFGAVLPTPAQLVAQALTDPPPTELHLQFQRHVGQALTALAAAAGGVAAAAGALSPQNAFNAFQQVGVTSSNPAVVSGSASSGARISSYTLSVLRLAAAQENLGELLGREAPAALDPGEHSFELRTYVGVKQLRVAVVPGESNDSVLTQMAAAINQANLGVIATLVRPTTSTVQLAVTAHLSGGTSGFSLVDVDGWLVRVSGASRVAREPQDAAYILNGVRTMSPSNHILLQGGKVQLNLHTVSRGVEQVVSVGPDRSAVVAAVSQLGDAMNHLAEVISVNERYLAPSFVADFNTAIQALRPALQQVGVDVTPDNRLALNRLALEYVFDQQPDLVESVLGSPTGVAQRIGSFATEIMAAPISRFGAPEFIPPVGPRTSHPTPQTIMASNSLSALLYTQLLAQGLFINSLL